jgi:hypothetical protein
MVAMLDNGSGRNEHFYRGHAIDERRRGMATGEVEAMYFLLNIPYFILYIHPKKSCFPI